MHLKLMLLLANLFLGIWVINFIYYRYRNYHSLYLKSLIGYQFAQNLIFLIIFFSKYFDINIWQDDIAFKSKSILPYTFLFFYLAILLIVFYSYQIYNSFKEKKISTVKTKTLILISGVAILIVFATSLIVINEKEFGFIFSLLDSIPIIFVGCEIYFLLKILVNSKKFSFPSIITLQFSTLYLSRYILIPIFILILPENFGTFVSMAFVNLIPIFWIKRYIDDLEQKPIVKNDEGNNFSKLIKEFGLSEREQEVLSLVLKGKSNKEIQVELFISYHTVKNHIYNIFQKTNSSSRYQLISLFTSNNNES